jgi:APA family basic amino acid/polyamine antiporter
MLNLPVQTWIRFVVWMLVGLVVYFLYGRRNSRLRRAADAAAREPVTRSL